MTKTILIITGFIIEAIYIAKVAIHLDKKINELDEAVYQHMKDEHNARVEDYIPRDYYEKVVEALCEKHTQEIAEQTEPSTEEKAECPFNDKIPCEWVCPNSTDCGWK